MYRNGLERKSAASRALASCRSPCAHGDAPVPLGAHTLSTKCDCRAPTQLLLAHLSRQLHSRLTLVSCVENFIFPNTDQFPRDSIRFHRLACNPAEYSVHAHGPHGPRGALGARLECCPGAPGIPAGRFEERPSTLQMYFTKGNGPLSMKWP